MPQPPLSALWRGSLADIPRDRCVVYLDDLLAHAADFDSALANLRDVFFAIRKAGLRLHPRKCHLFRRKRSFLGHVVSAAGVSTDPAKEPEGQLARWLETLQDYNFEVGSPYNGLAASMSTQTLCLDGHVKEMTTAAVVDLSGGPQTSPMDLNHCFESIDPKQLRHDQSQDPVLSRVHEWMGAGQRPKWLAVSALDTEVNAFYSQWSSLVSCGGLLHRAGRPLADPWGVSKRDVLQLLVPRRLRPRVLQLVHGSVGAGHFGITKTLQRLRSRFYWPGCHQDVELYVHQLCDTCTAKKGPTCKKRANPALTCPPAAVPGGGSMERVAVDILGPFPATERGNRYILVAMATYLWLWTILLSGRRPTRYLIRVPPPLLNTW
ncbi:hypothetical protein L3Q82_001438 [Scortum barcoo]|uniref:Uncharacterized protein n=1 Tax=Scortum barcoo TaxID=214431 RepID=A0ACB8W7H4_9TELE|nr:hypothetical protein L3Q82_001438 [Scortum barcoo]